MAPPRTGYVDPLNRADGSTHFRARMLAEATRGRGSGEQPHTSSQR
jgi:hypothetical protein